MSVYAQLYALRILGQTDDFRMILYVLYEIHQ